MKTGIFGKFAVGGLALCSFLLLVSPAVMAGDAAELEIKEVTWKKDGSQLEVKAKGKAGPAAGSKQWVTVLNADTDVLVSRDQVEISSDGEWELEVKVQLTAAPPCRISVHLNGLSDEAETEDAPADCVNDASTGDVVVVVGSDSSAETGSPENAETEEGDGTPEDTAAANGGETAEDTETAEDSEAGSADPLENVATSSLTIKGAKWLAWKHLLKVKAIGQSDSSVDEVGQQINVINADTGELIASKSVKIEDDSAWELELKTRLSGEPPCRIRVEWRDALGEADIVNAPDDCDNGGNGGGEDNLAPIANAGADQSVTIPPGQTTVAVMLDGSLSADTEGQVANWMWSGTPDPADIVQPQLQLTAGEYQFSLVVTDDEGANSFSDTVQVIIVQQGDGIVSINSTSANSDTRQSPVAPASLVNNGDYALLAANDLGMHCADLDYRVFSILPPFNVMHAQVVRKGRNGDEPALQDDQDIEVVYSAASNPNDPALDNDSKTPVFKGNFWSDEDGDGRTLGYDTYAPLFFGLLQPQDIAQQDSGLPVPDSALLRNCLQGYLDGTEGAEGPRANCGFGQQHMPGHGAPYASNEPVLFDRFDHDVNFFNELLGGVGLGGIIRDTNWFAADGVPILPVDDAGRPNAYPVLRIQARDKTSGEILASTDMVVPVASEADCQGCHAAPIDCASTTEASGIDFSCNGVAVNRTAYDVMTLDGDSADQLPPGDTALELLSNVAKINILRLHDAKHGTTLDAQRPVQCSTCHYSPALDLAQLGPMDSPGTGQTRHITMSRAMHGHHGELKDDAGQPLFPLMPSPEGRDTAVAQQVLGETCYQCHPGKRTQCLRGAMAAGGVVCQDCHGEMNHVGNDFSESLADNAWPAGANLNKRVPWASEPGCGTCHTGDAVNNMANQVAVPSVDNGIRLLQSYTVAAGLNAAGNPDGTESARMIQPRNKRFAENETLYRLSKGHGGVMCEGCHGSTHAIFPNPNPWANDNLTSTQLQGHRGTLIECKTCHEGSLGLTMGGPHGMHPVNDPLWTDKHEEIAEGNKNSCRTCHGRNGEGTVLSRTATAREFVCEEDSGSLCQRKGEVVRVAARTKIGCGECHENELR